MQNGYNCFNNNQYGADFTLENFETILDVGAI